MIVPALELWLISPPAVDLILIPLETKSTALSSASISVVLGFNHLVPDPSLIGFLTLSASLQLVPLLVHLIRTIAGLNPSSMTVSYTHLRAHET